MHALGAKCSKTIQYQGKSWRGSNRLIRLWPIWPLSCLIKLLPSTRWSTHRYTLLRNKRIHSCFYCAFMSRKWPYLSLISDAGFDISSISYTYCKSWWQIHPIRFIIRLNIANNRAFSSEASVCHHRLHCTVLVIKVISVEELDKQRQTLITSTYSN